MLMQREEEDGKDFLVFCKYAKLLSTSKNKYLRSLVKSEGIVSFIQKELSKLVGLVLSTDKLNPRDGAEK